MKTEVFKKILAVLLSVVLLGSSLSVAAFAASAYTPVEDTYLISDTERAIAPGVVENRVILNNSTGTQQEMVYAVTVDMSEGSTASIMAGYADYNGAVWKMQTVRAQANAAANKRGVNIVAAVNADIFNMQTGEPTGPLVMGGTVYKSALGHPYFGITKSGGAVMGASLTQGVLDTLDECVGGFYMLLENGQRTSYALERDTYVAPHTAVGLKADGNLVIVTIDGRNYPVSCSCDNYYLTTILLGLGCVTALNLDGGGSSTYLAKYEGTDNLVLANNPSDAVERQVASSLFVVSSARPSGEFDHASIQPNNLVYTPGSTVQFSATGVDSAGGSAQLPSDGAFELADPSMGTIDAETGLFIGSEQTGVVAVNYTSGGEVVGSTSIELAHPDELYFPSEEFSLDFDETTDFELKAKNQGRDVIIKSGDIVWSIADESENDIEGIAGSFSGLEFTACESGSAVGIVTAKYALDETVFSSTKVVIGAAPVMLYDFEYTDNAEEAEASDGRLQYIPSLTLPTFNSATDGNYYDKAYEWQAEGYPLFSWPNASLGVSGMTSKVVSVDDGEPVRFGDHSLRIDFDYSTYDKSSNSNNYLRLTDDSYFFEGSPKAISAWVYIPEGVDNFCLYLNCGTKNLMETDANGRPLAANAAYAPVSTVTEGGTVCTNWTGWKYVEIDLSDDTAAASTNMGLANAPFGYYHGCGVFWISYQPGKGFGSKSAGTIYIDNIQLIYSSNTDDTKNPEVSSITYETDSSPVELTDGEAVISSNTMTFRAFYNDVDDKYMTGIDSDKVSMQIDGVDVTDKCYINAGDEEMYLYDACLDNGPHSISITVYDVFGNRTIETRYFTVEGEAEAAAELVAEQENPILGEDYTLAIKGNDISDITGANIAVHTFAKFTSYYGDVAVEPAEGFSLTEDPVYDSTNATVKFSVARNGEAVSDDGVIARIVYGIPFDVPSDSIEVSFRLDKGEILFASEKDEKYFGSISGRIDTECIAPLIISADTMLVGSEGGYFTVTDLDGEPVEGAYVYNSDGSLLSQTATDEDGKLFTSAFTGSLVSYSVYAQFGDVVSFIYSSQSFKSGGSEDGMPTSVVANGASDGSTMFNISWFASPLMSEGEAVVKYATKAAYEANGEAAFAEIYGISRLEELDSTGNIETNYALRFNKAVITGLEPATEYVYIVGDGEKMSDVFSFTTCALNVDTDFFIIGDMQDDDTSNLEAILDALDNADSDFIFGLQTGDAVDNGGMYRWWTNVASIFSSGYLSTRPIVHVLGNHEYYGDFSGENATDYFGMTAREDSSAPYAYSVQYGNVYLAVINYFDQIASYEAAVEWVREDASANNARWKVLSIHQPAYYTNPGGGNGIVHNLIPALVDEVGFNFVFSGHDHSYMRTYAVTGGQRDDENGAVYYICGSTGEKSYQVVETSGFPYDFVRGSNAVEGEYSAIYLTAHTTDTEFTVYTHDVIVNGDGTYSDVIIDSYTMTRPITCTEAGSHDYAYFNGKLICSVCGYTRELGSYSGFASDAETGATRYFLGGVMQTGWLNYGEDCYYLDENGLAVTGSNTIDGIKYDFDDDGKQIGAAFVVWDDGYTRAYRGGQYMTSWTEIDGKLYYFSTSPSYPGRMFTGVTTIRIYTGQNVTYNFADDGHLLEGTFVEEEDGIVYFWGQDRYLGWHEINGATYYFDMATGYMAVGETEIDGAIYSFDNDGKLLHEGAHDYVYSHHQDGTCTVDDAEVYICSICSSQYNEVITAAPGHVDANNDRICDVCEEYIGGSVFFARLISFFQMIRNWFRNLFDWFRNLFTFSNIGNIG